MHMYNMEGPIWVQAIDSMKLIYKLKVCQFDTDTMEATRAHKNTHTHLESIFCVILF